MYMVCMWNLQMQSCTMKIASKKLVAGFGVIMTDKTDKMNISVKRNELILCMFRGCRTS